MLVADVRAQTSIVEAEMPTYRQLVQARDQAKAILDNRESAIRAFLLDLRRRGCFQTPPTAERGWSH
jgi:hypothetical protein